MNLKDYFSEKELKKAENLIQEFHGRMLLDNSITNPLAIILSIYMLSNQDKSPLIEKKAVKNLFISFGRESREFDKALYELSGKRKGKKQFIDIKEKEQLGLNFEGLKKIRNILEGKKDE